MAVTTPDDVDLALAGHDPETGETADRERERRWFIAAAVFLGLLFLVRLVFLLWFSPFNLIEDEAHYWEWSRHLDWSYYSKGPAIAYIIAAGTALLGDTEAGVRLFAPVCSLITGVCVFLLGREITRSDAKAFLGMVALHLAPIITALGVLMTIDGPYLAGWSASCLLAYLAFERGKAWAWPGLGLALGIAFLAKYTALLLLPGLVIYLFIRRGRLPRRPAWAVPLFIVVLLFTMSPVAIWNAQHDWVTVRHLLGHAHMGGNDDKLNWQPWWFAEYMGTQLGAVGVTLLPLAIGGIAWAVRGGPSRELKPGAVFLICCGLPVLGFYTLAGLFIEIEGNWPLAGYVTLLPLAAWAAADRLGLMTRGKGTVQPSRRWWWRTAWHWSIGYGVVGGILAFRPDAVNLPISLVNRLGADLPYVFPHERLIGAHEFAADVDALNDRFDGRLFYIAGHYGRASLLAFYCRNHPAVFSGSARMQGRRAEQDLWPETNLDNPALQGRNALLIGEVVRKWQREEAFDEIIICEPARFSQKGRLLHNWELYLGVGYRGFAQQERNTF